MPKTPTAQQPLAGLEVIELSTMVTCSLSAMMLRTQGAHVVKVEPTDIGDPMRIIGSQKGGVSALFHNCNRGKRSLAIDLKHKNGAEAVRRLAGRADILLNNYRPGVMDRLGIGSDVVRTINPRLINVSVTGFGTVGPMAHRPAYDHVIQGMSGITALQGDENKHQFIKMLICDKVTAYTVAQAATAALVGRAATGEGQHIDISMLHACLAFMWPDGMTHLTLKDDDAIDLPPISDYYQTVNAKDGAVAAAPLADHHWDAILTLIDRADLKTDPRFATLPGRIAHMGEVIGILKDAALHLSVDEVMQAFEAADIPSAECEHQTTLEANAQVQAIGALETYVTENMGRLSVPTPPVLFDGQATSLAEPSPNLGQHSHAIMQELGFADEVITTMADEGDLLCG